MASQPRPLPRAFFARDAATVARELLGMTIVRAWADDVGRAGTDPVHGGQRAGDRAIGMPGPCPVSRWRIVETEAYVGPHDAASHSRAGPTARNQAMFGPPGHAYVYLIYGVHQMLNVVAGDNDGQAVLVRAAERLPDAGPPQSRAARGRIEQDGLTTAPVPRPSPTPALPSSGSGARGPGLLARQLGLGRAHDGHDLRTAPLWIEQGVRPTTVAATPRIGVEYAGAWRDEPLRFIDADSPFLSRPWKPGRADARGP